MLPLSARTRQGKDEGWLCRGVAVIELNLTVGVRQNLFFRRRGMGAPRGRNPSGCGGVGKTGDEVGMKPAVPRFAVCGGEGWREEQRQPGFLLRKKCHVMVRGEQAEGDVSHEWVACEVHLWMQEDENIKTPHM